MSMPDFTNMKKVGVEPDNFLPALFGVLVHMKNNAGENIVHVKPINNSAELAMCDMVLQRRDQVDLIAKYTTDPNIKKMRKAYSDRVRMRRMMRQAGVDVIKFAVPNEKHDLFKFPPDKEISLHQRDMNVRYKHPLAKADGEHWLQNWKKTDPTIKLIHDSPDELWKWLKNSPHFAKRDELLVHNYGDWYMVNFVRKSDGSVSLIPFRMVVENSFTNKGYTRVINVLFTLNYAFSPEELLFFEGVKKFISENSQMSEIFAMSYVIKNNGKCEFMDIEPRLNTFTIQFFTMPALMPLTRKIFADALGLADVAGTTLESETWNMAVVGEKIPYNSNPDIPIMGVASPRDQACKFLNNVKSIEYPPVEEPGAKKVLYLIKASTTKSAQQLKTEIKAEYP